MWSGPAALLFLAFLRMRRISGPVIGPFSMGTVGVWEGKWGADLCGSPMSTGEVLGKLLGCVFHIAFLPVGGLEDCGVYGVRLP